MAGEDSGGHRSDRDIRRVVRDGRRDCGPREKGGQNDGDNIDDNNLLNEILSKEKKAERWKTTVNRQSSGKV